MIKTKAFLLLFCTAFIYILFPCRILAQNGQVFAAVEKGGKWGYIDTLGKLQIPFTMEKAGSFNEGLANVKYGKDWGYIDKKGTLKLKPFFITANPFHDGRALISYFDPKDSVKYRGYINKDGYLVSILQPTEQGYDFNDGYARIVSKTKNGLLFGFKDTSDNFAIAPTYENAGDFHEGKAAVSSAAGWGFIDQKNNVIVPMQYDDAYYFESGVAYIASGKNTSFVNAKGEMVFTVTYDEVDVLAQDGMICFRDKGKIGFMDTKGKVVIKPQFTGKLLTRFKNGLAPIQGDDGKYGYINKKGKYTIQPQFDDAQFFSNNYASVKINGKYGYIDKTGKIVIQPEYDSAYEFEPTDVY